MRRPGQPSLGATLLLLAGCGDLPSTQPPTLPALAEREGRDIRDEIIYQVLVDRFEDAAPEPAGPVQKQPDDLSRIQGGDWQGLRSRLGYIRDLGMTAIWISPIVENVARGDGEDGYHGYWASDFTRLNPYFGELADLQALVDDAHALGLRVFIDVAPNHAGPVFYYDFDADGQRGDGELEPPFQPEGPYEAPLAWSARPALFRGRASPSDGTAAPSAALERFELDERHFHRRGQTLDFLDPSQLEYGDFPFGLRDLRTEDADVLEGLIDTFAEWVRLTDADGFRLDAVPHASHEFWTALCGGLRARLAELGKSQFFVFGEVFRTDPRELASYTGPGSMDSVLDFSFKFDVIQRFLLEGGAPAAASPALESYRQFYPTEPQPGGVGLDPWQARVAFADNHDTGRVRGAVADPRALEAALTLVFTLDAVPSVYYGTEQGFSGAIWHDAREPMWWSGFAEDGPGVRHVRKLAILRRSHESLNRGELRVLYASENDGFSQALDASLLVFERWTATERVLVAVNGHAQQRSSVAVSTGFAAGTRLVDALEHVPDELVVGGDGVLELSVPPREALLLVRR